MGLGGSGTKAIAQHLISRGAAGLPERSPDVSPEGTTVWRPLCCLGLDIRLGCLEPVVGLGVLVPEGTDPQHEIFCTAWQDAEAICASLAGGALLQNGQTAEIQEEVALTNLGSSSGASKRHSAADKMHFPRSNLQTITTLGMMGHPGPCPQSCRKPVAETLARPSQKTGCAGVQRALRVLGCQIHVLSQCMLSSHVLLCTSRQGGVW